MTLHVKHNFHSGKADGADATLVKPSNWNEDHVLTTDSSGQIVLGAAAAGPIQELPLGYSASQGGIWQMQASTGAFAPPRGTTAQRPSGLPDGGVRYNSDTAQLEVQTGGQWLALQAGTLMPPGAMLPYGGTSVPGGFLLCDGSRYNRSSFPALYSAIGVLWDTGNDGSTFLVPNMIGRVFAHADYSGTVLGFGIGVGGKYGGRYFSWGQTEGQMPSHRHWHARDDNGNSLGFEYASNGGGGVTGSGNAMQDMGVSSTWSGYDGSGQTINTDVMQPTAFGYFIIKY